MLPTATEIGDYEQNLNAYADNADDDTLELALRKIDRSVKVATGTSLFHILTLASIAGSIALFASGKRSLGIFVGLWSPTFQALKAATESKKGAGQR